MDRSMKLKDVTAVLEKKIPLALAQDWDNVGLLLGDREQKIRHILLTVDVTPEVATEAQVMQADLILAYHPLIFDGLKCVTAQGPGRVVYQLIQAGIAVYSIHTAYDVISGGVNDGLARILGLQETSPIGDYVPNPQGPHYKIVTFVPRENAEQVADALYQAGAGHIGQYSHCGFESEGTGTFLPLAGAHPTIGQPGQRERVAEIKLESVVRADHVTAVIAALRRSHPYETPAFDVFRHYDLEQSLGLGRMGTLAVPTDLSLLLTQLKRGTGARQVGLIGPARRKVRRAAVCAGSCGKLIQQVIAGGCDLYVTGELRHHTALAAQAAGLTVVCLSHSVSERFMLKHLARELKGLLGDVSLKLSKKDKDPFTWKAL